MNDYEIVPSGENYHPQGPTNFGSPVTHNSDQVAQNLRPQQPGLLNNPNNAKLLDWERKQQQILQSMGAMPKEPQLPAWAKPVNADAMKQQRVSEHKVSHQEALQQHVAIQQQKQEQFSTKIEELESKERELREKYRNKSICVEHQRQVEEVWNKAREVEKRYDDNNAFFRKVKDLLGDV